jgi:hypothetical protein
LDQVFLDANIIKFGTESFVFRPLPRKLVWGDRPLEGTVHESSLHSWKDGLDGKGKAESDLLPEICRRALRGEFSFVTDAETLLEVWGLPGSVGERRVMSDVPITTLDPPFRYSRIMFGPQGSPNELQEQFFHGIQNARYLEIAVGCGIRDGHLRRRNVYADAYALWSAETAECRYFLTLDLKLLRRLKNSPKLALRTRPVSPSELLSDLSPPGSGE